MNHKPTIRCAVYTRKSSEDGLEQDFNSLHAQREACQAYITSQKHEGWQVIKTAYDDGGFSGGNMDRPALKQLITDIEAEQVNVVVVYKVDRLTRSLADFARIIDRFDRHGVSFVSVTQQFNTTSSMGRLTLNVLLSFAQFEREVTGERIRDKIAASKKKGIWMGGFVPLGYDVKERKLIVNPQEAETLRFIFNRYLELGCVRLLHEDLKSKGIRSRSSSILSRGALYKMLSNPIYIGQIRHHRTCYPGQHDAIVDQELWDKVQHGLRSYAVKLAGNRKTMPSLLMGKLFDESGEALTPSHCVKNGRRYRYYISHCLITGPARQSNHGWRVPAHEIEQTIAQAAFRILNDQSILTPVLREAGITVQHMPAVLTRCSNIAAEEVLNLIQRAELSSNGIRLTLALASLAPQAPFPPIIEQDIPMQMKRRGVEMRLVVSPPGGEPRIDMTLINTIRLAHRWFEELVSGQVASFSAIARREGLTNGRVSYIMNLAFLAPGITDAIVSGQQPAELSTEILMKRTDLPLNWQDQKKVLGFC